ncbi:MAG: methyltransferase [Panacagrimonas sp.]
MTFFEQDSRNALESKQHAQWIAFGPSVFQAARSLRDNGTLREIARAGEDGVDFETLAARVDVPRYGLRVLLEAGLGIGLLTRREGRFRTTRTAWFLLHDPLTRANMDFTHDVSYLGLFSLDESVRSGRPEGLKNFGGWDTIYEGVGQLPVAARDAWLNFVHFYSDVTFDAALPLVFERKPKRLMDVGGNTGRFARRCLAHDDEVRVTIADLAGALDMARADLPEPIATGRLRLEPVDLLSSSLLLPREHDAIWMSQLLDCFAESEILAILQRCHEALSPGGRVYILEPFWDRQRFQSAAFCLQQTSLYFTAIANGRGQMYESTLFLEIVRRAGFEIERQHDHLGVSHTLLVCRRAGDTG